MLKKPHTKLLAMVLVALAALLVFPRRSSEPFPAQTADQAAASQSASLKGKSGAEVKHQAQASLTSQQRQESGSFVRTSQVAAKQWSFNSEQDELARFAYKMPSVLRDQLEYLEEHPEEDDGIPVIVRVKPEYLDEAEAQGHNTLSLVNSYAAKLNAEEIRDLVKSNVVEYVTQDAPIRVTGEPTDKGNPNAPVDSEESNPFDHILATIGADQISVRGKAPSGRNVAVAVFDSGISHSELEDGGNVWASIDFTSGVPVVTGDNVDEYGHGTHVAGIIGGQDLNSKEKFSGIAPSVSFLDLKVVGKDGTGLTSNLITAIDWAITNKNSYFIKVANLSLGHAPIESYKDDPLCQAVERMVEAGIVTVASAGNLGRTDEYPEIWGAINSPANSPAVITVGAVNTQGTVTHTDDIATTFSSRGPTYVDNLFKPDLVAPGNAVTSMLSEDDSYIKNNYSELVADGYLNLSGSSMAAAVVSGTVALMFEENYYLNPNVTKMVLLLTAVKMQQPHMLEQGNGLVNAKTAVEMAEAIDMFKETITKDVIPVWNLPAGEEVYAGGAFASGNEIVYSELINTELVEFWGSGTIWSEGIFWSDRKSWTNGIFWSDRMFSNGIFWSDRMSSSNGLVTADGIFWSDRIHSNGIFWSDRSAKLHAAGTFDALSVFWGDRRGMNSYAPESDDSGFGKSVFWGDRKGIVTEDESKKFNKSVFWGDRKGMNGYAPETNYSGPGGNSGFGKSVFWGDRRGMNGYAPETQYSGSSGSSFGKSVFWGDRKVSGPNVNYSGSSNNSGFGKSVFWGDRRGFNGPDQFPNK